ncbi:MAG TPA: type II toxin-antitoxin system VapC family toxin [Polyangiaceae bacterium]
MNALLDTHALVWWVDGSKKLAREQSRATERAASTGALFLSEISFWEIAVLVEAGKLTFREPLDEWLERAAAAPAVQRIGITPTIAREVASLSTTRNWDPADRIIVATARVLGARLVTSDSRIIDSKLVPTI